MLPSISPPNYKPSPLFIIYTRFSAKSNKKSVLLNFFEGYDVGGWQSYYCHPIIWNVADRDGNGIPISRKLQWSVPIHVFQSANLHFEMALWSRGVDLRSQTLPGLRAGSGRGAWRYREAVVVAVVYRSRLLSVSKRSITLFRKIFCR